MADIMFWLGKTISPEDEGDESIGDALKDGVDSVIGIAKAVKGKIVPKTVSPVPRVSLSPIEVIILAHLRSRELRNEGQQTGQYGYELIQELNKLFAGSWEAKSGTIYPILSKLEGNKGLLEGGRKASPLGPVKKVYELTDTGRQAIDAIIKENLPKDLEFIMNYFDLLTPFVQSSSEDLKSEEIFEKMLAIPAKGAILAMEKGITETDEKLRQTKLRGIKAHLEKIVVNLEAELAKSVQTTKP